MHGLRSYAVAFAALLSPSLFAPAAAKSSVVSLTGSTFNDFIKSHDLVLAEFYAPWCGHCKMLAPEYESAAKQLSDRNIPLVKIDCDANGDVCADHGINGYPTMKVFRGLDNVKPYRGTRKAEGISSFMIKQSLPVVSSVTPENFEEVKSLNKIVVVAYFDKDDKASNETFTKVAEKFRDSFLFAATNDAGLAKAEGVSQPAIALYKEFDEGKDTFTSKFAVDDITAFVKSSSTPLVGAVSPETFEGYMTAGIPLAYLFAESPEDIEKYAEMLRPIAKDHKGKINIATVDATLFGPHAANINLNPEKFPAFAIQDTINNKKYPFDQSKKITDKNIRRFVEGVLDGKIEPNVRSQPIPEKQEGPVTVVVGRTYNELVIDNDKDVLLEFYAPWCGHCKALAPKYEELASLYTESEKSKVTIAKINANENDTPEEIEGFPTIKIFPAGSKNAPIEYLGSRSVEDMANFVRDNGKYKVDALHEPEEEEEDAGQEQKPVDEATTPSAVLSGSISGSTSEAATASEAAMEDIPASEADKGETGKKNARDEL